MLKQNPWRGLSAYREPKDNDEYKYLFCGRDNATKELSNLIDSNLFVTLYGRTGIGKTSLLEAGVFPVLRKLNYIPVVIRFSLIDSIDQNFASYVIECVEKQIERIDEYNDDTPSSDSNDINRLWEYFATRRFYIGEQQVYPIIVLDQFEENFTSHKVEITFFLEQLYSLISDNKIYLEGYHDETNFRVVISIREDDLFKLEDCIDQQNLVDFKFNRYRLLQMTESEAKEVISIPGNEFLPNDPENREKVIDEIIKVVKNGSHGEINTLILSLICSILFNKIVAQGDKLISVDDVVFLGDNPLLNYYKSLQLDKNTKNIIEDRFVDVNGRRNALNVGELDFILPNWRNYVNGEKRILQIVNNKVELIHDMLAKAVYECKKERKNNVRELTLFISLTSYMIPVGFIVWEYLEEILRSCWALMHGDNLKKYLKELFKENYFESDVSSFGEGVVFFSLMFKFLFIYYIVWKLPKSICLFFYSEQKLNNIVGLFMISLLFYVMSGGYLQNLISLCMKYFV